MGWSPITPLQTAVKRDGMVTKIAHSHLLVVKERCCLLIVSETSVSKSDTSSKTVTSKTSKSIPSSNSVASESTNSVASDSKSVASKSFHDRGNNWKMLSVLHHGGGVSADTMESSHDWYTSKESISHREADQKENGGDLVHDGRILWCVHLVFTDWSTGCGGVSA